MLIAQWIGYLVALISYRIRWGAYIILLAISFLILAALYSVIFLIFFTLLILIVPYAFMRLLPIFWTSLKTFWIILNAERRQFNFAKKIYIKDKTQVPRKNLYEELGNHSANYDLLPKQEEANELRPLSTNLNSDIAETRGDIISFFIKPFAVFQTQKARLRIMLSLDL